MLPTLLLLLQSAGDPGPAYDGRARRLDVHPPRIDTTVTIDGRLDEAVWGQAAVLTGFSEYRPADSRPAADSTQVLVWYAPDAIYFGVRAFEAHGAVVRATLADRDNIDRDDRIHILLDTFHDHRRALLFAVNPLGVQQDGVLSDGVDDGSAGGLSDLHRGLVMEATPEFTTRVEGQPRPAGGPYLYTGDPELGVNLRWGLTQNLNLSGTANPDFSQVEADIGQVTVNQRFALFYPEKRPFFLE